MKNATGPTGSVDARGHGLLASFPASRDRFAGLTGPAFKDGRRVAGSMAGRRPGFGADGPDGRSRCRQAPTATRTKSVAKATKRPASRATLAAIGSENFRQTAIISLKT